MAPLNLPSATVVSAKNKNKTLMTDHFNRVNKGVPSKRSNLFSDAIAVDNISKQEPSKFRKKQQS